MPTTAATRQLLSYLRMGLGIILPFLTFHPWWSRLKMGRLAYWRNHVVVTVLSALGIVPKGTVDVHKMLFKTADFLTRGGDIGIFSPMHMILCRKPKEQEK
ncbi:unnamed protein product [Vicia faba]|uniref:SAM-dependent methyltransferase Erg6/SMT-type domain-containing protein n=1 Tax=Vicia faba TaxID=3906 RepID=A0AAV1B863_VICFA|nr:unnamed protein product [Vicia faba]CAI8618656.1 unnamed protein product [Vicia faba]